MRLGKKINKKNYVEDILAEKLVNRHRGIPRVGLRVQLGQPDNEEFPKTNRGLELWASWAVGSQTLD